jgi:hypothetical protein
MPDYASSDVWLEEVEDLRVTVLSVTDKIVRLRLGEMLDFLREMSGVMTDHEYEIAGREVIDSAFQILGAYLRGESAPDWSAGAKRHLVRLREKLDERAQASKSWSGGAPRSVLGSEAPATAFEGFPSRVGGDGSGQS